MTDRYWDTPEGRARFKADRQKRIKEKRDKLSYRFTEKELVDHISSDRKWYDGHFKQQTASAISKRGKEGRLSRSQLKDLLDKFGYEESQPALYRKKR